MWSSRRSKSWGLWLGASIAAYAACAAAEENLKAELQSRYGAVKQAMSAHDAPAIRALLAPDFASIDVTGESKTAEQMISQVDSLPRDANKTSETTLLSVLPTADKVTVAQKYDMKAVRDGADGAAHQIELIAFSTDTWVRSGDVWLLQRTVTNEMSLLKDGKLVVHKAKS